ANFTAGASTSLANYSLPTVATGSAAITPKALGASLSGVGKVYDGSTTAVLNGANYLLTGLVTGESASVSQTAGLYNSADVLGANSVSASLSGANFTAGASTSLANYSLPSVATGSASITAKALSATLSGVGKVYDGSTAATLTGANYQLTGLVAGESASVSQTAGLYNSADVLGANSVSASLSGANFTAGASTSLANYSLPTVATGSAAITAKPLAASLSGVGKVYDGNNSALLGAGNFNLSGFVGTQSASVTHTGGVYNGVNVATANSVTTSLSAGDFTAGAATTLSNYSLPTVATGSASITAKSLGATISGVSKVYDGGTAAALTGANYQLTGLVGGESASVSQTAGLYNSADVLGANSVSASLSGASFTAGASTSLANYSLPTVATGSAAITPKPLAASLTGTISKTYDGGNSALLGAGNFSLTGFVGTQSASVTHTGGVYNAVNVATANSVTASLSAGDFTAGAATTLSNYSLPTVATGSASITAKALGATLTGALGRSYDGTALASLTGSNFVLSGLAAGESINVAPLNGSYDSRNAGTRTVSATLAGSDFTAGSGTVLGNYVLPTSAAGTAVITPKAITLSAPVVSKVYDGTLAYSASAGDLSTLSAALVQGDTVSGATFSYADKNAGNGSKAVNLTQAQISDGNGGANYSVSLAGNSNSTITPRVLNASATGANRVYDTSTNASVSLIDDRIAGDVLTLSNSSASFADKNAGSNKLVTVSGIAAGGADAGNYTLASGTATTTASITPATLQVTGVSAQDRAYDTSLAAGLSGTAVVTALGSDIVKVTGTGIGQFLDKNAGSGKAITVTGYASSDSNYVLAQPTGLSATVTPAVLALSGLNPGVSKTYDGSTRVTITGAPTVSGFGNEVVTVGGVGSGQFADKNAGTGKTITVSGLTASDSNYAIGQQAGLTGTIAPAQLTLAPVTAATRSYDGTSNAQINAASYAFTGLVSGDSVNVVKTTGSFDSRNAGNRTVSIGLAAGDYTAGNGTVLANYLLPTLATGSGVITAKTITLNAPSISKVYDGTLAYSASAGDLSALSAALVQGDTVSGAAFSYADKNAGNGNKAVNLTQAQISDGNGGANYSVTLAGNSNSTITPRVLNASATGANRVYDTSTNASVSLIDDRIAGDVLTLSNSSASFADKNAGSNKAVTVSGIAAGGADAGNYTLASGTATTTASITPATLQVTGVSAQDRAYDTSLAAGLSGTAVVTALGSDIVKVTGTGIGQFLDKNAGSGKAITVTGYASSDSNYVLAQPTGLSATVTPAVLALSGLNPGVSKTYDGSTRVAITGAPTVSGFGNEVVTVGGVGSGQFADKNAGTGKTITVSGLTASDSNYAIGQQAGLTGTIAPAQLTLAPVTAATRSYDGTSNAQINAASYAFTGLVSGDSVTVNKTAGTFDSRNAGNRSVSIGLAAGDYTAGNGTVLANYLLPTLATGSGVITAKTIVLNAPSISKVYDGTLAYSASAGDLSALSAALVQGDTVSGAAFSYADKNAGNGNKAVNLTQAQISDGNGGANYSVTLAGNSNSTITPRVLNASATGANRVYDTSTNASVSLIDDRIAGDVLTLSNTAASFADKNAGSNKVVTVSGIAAGGADAGNYTLASGTATTTASITPATLQVTGVSVLQRSYDRSLNAVLGGAPTVTALGTDVVSVVGTASGSYADKNVGSGKAVTVNGYRSSDSNYVLLQPTGLTGTVTPAVLQVSGLTLAAAKTYDGTRNVTLSGTASVTGLDGEVVTVGGNGSGQFADKNVGTGKVITLVGYTASDSNYAIGQEPGLVGSITPAAITVTGVRANGKSFDGNTSATLSGVGAINVIGADVVTLGGTASASFADATAGTAKPVTVSGYALAGADAGNYALRQPQGLSADIADTAVQVPPPAVVTPPPLPSLPLAAQRAAPGLSMPPLGNLPGTGTGLSSAAPAATPAPSSAAPAPSSATSATTPAPASATPAPSSAASAATPAPASDTPAPSSAASAATPAPASDTPAATPAPASATPAAQANTAGITVALVRPPSLQQGGAITVSVPKQIVDAGNGFGFPLPAQVVEAAAVNRVPVQAQLADGSALPSWISYNTDSKSFVVTQVPGGALPVQIVLVIGAQRTTMVVAER
ncbi:S-layer family protein, partial [Janthinobacterium sp. PC23-8]|uniref:beta strand repeat-containing protein n=1 Tax=Janthinobacterium sp. PC23-8 TaxID=2012679 RepID=UPI000BD1E4FC